jgi:molybdate transport system substrate-binding protein
MTAYRTIATTLLGVLSAVMMSTAVHAADITLLGSTAMREPLEELIPMFEKATGHKVTMTLFPAATR